MNDTTFTKGGPRLLLPLILLLIVGIGLLSWWFFTRQTSTLSNISTNPHFNATVVKTSKGTPSEVATLVRQQVAQRLHLSIDQLTAQLQSGTAIGSLAEQQGMSANAWRTFVLATYQAAYNQAVSAGELTQARADHDMQNIRAYPPDALNSWVTNDCLGITTS